MSAIMAYIHGAKPPCDLCAKLYVRSHVPKHCCKNKEVAVLLPATTRAADSALPSEHFHPTSSWAAKAAAPPVSTAVTWKRNFLPTLQHATSYIVYRDRTCCWTLLLIQKTMLHGPLFQGSTGYICIQYCVGHTASRGVHEPCDCSTAS